MNNTDKKRARTDDTPHACLFAPRRTPVSRDSPSRTPARACAMPVHPPGTSIAGAAGAGLCNSAGSAAMRAAAPSPSKGPSAPTRSSTDQRLARRLPGRTATDRQDGQARGSASGQKQAQGSARRYMMYGGRTRLFIQHNGTFLQLAQPLASGDRRRPAQGHEAKQKMRCCTVYKHADKLFRLARQAHSVPWRLPYTLETQHR